MRPSQIRSSRNQGIPYDSFDSYESFVTTICQIKIYVCLEIQKKHYVMPLRPMCYTQILQH